MPATLHIYPSLIQSVHSDLLFCSLTRRMRCPFSNAKLLSSSPCSATTRSKVCQVDPIWLSRRRPEVCRLAVNVRRYGRETRKCYRLQQLSLNSRQRDGIRQASEENAIAQRSSVETRLAEKFSICRPYFPSICDITNVGGRLRTVGSAEIPAFGFPPAQSSLVILSASSILRHDIFNLCRGCPS